MKFAQHHISIHGIDGSKVATALAREKLDASGIERYDLSVQNLDEARFKTNTDIIHCRLTYAFLTKKEHVLKTVKRRMKQHSVFVISTPVLYAGIEYTKEDKPGIAVNYNDTLALLRKTFPRVNIFDHEYVGDKGEIVTFLMMN